MDEIFDIVSIGDSTIDVFLDIDPEDAQSVCGLDSSACKIAFDYGSKVPVKAMHRVPGVGNAANLSQGISRLGLKAGIYTVIGDDRDSQEIKEVLEKEGVDTSNVVMERGKRSNFSAVLNYSGERTIFVYHEDRTYKLPKMETNWLYLSSVAKDHQGLHDEVLSFVKSSGIKLGFNPGSYQLRDGLEGLRPLLGVTEVLLLNREEAGMLVDQGIEDIKGLLKGLKEHTKGTVVMTDGRGGSYATTDGREVWHVGIPEEVPVVERTGAGDAYSTAFLAATIRGKDLPEAMRGGTMNSTSVVQFVGALEGLLTERGMEEYLERYSDRVKARMV